ncbi:MAG TPA: ABC transporter ATP-binding protein [bacterium]|nr:ABC transporter ATP-binding protein [bacterium]
MSTPILEVTALAKGYGRRPVLRGIDLRLQPGEHLGLVGNNGQGKTTLIRLILGLLRPDAGEIRLDGRVVPARRPPELKRLLGYLPEQVRFYPNLSGRRTLAMFARLKQVPRSEVERVLERVGLTEAADRRVKSFSKGMRQRLGLAQALLGQPRLLLLDEPTNGLDPDGIQMFYATLQELRAQGVAIVTASHLLSEIESRVDRLAVLHEGVFTHQGTIPALLAAEGMPTVIRFALREPRAPLPGALARLDPLTVANGKGPAYEVRLAQAQRFDVLGQLMAHQEALRTLVVHDAGLEELFRRIYGRSAETGDPTQSTAGENRS